MNIFDDFDDSRWIECSDGGLDRLVFCRDDAPPETVHVSMADLARLRAWCDAKLEVERQQRRERVEKALSRLRDLHRVLRFPDAIQARAEAQRLLRDVMSEVGAGLTSES